MAQPHFTRPLGIPYFGDNADACSLDETKLKGVTLVSAKCKVHATNWGPLIEIRSVRWPPIKVVKVNSVTY